MADRLPKLLAGLAMLLGVGVVAVGLSVFVEAWQANQAWAGVGHTPQADLPSEQAPLWLDAAPTPERVPTARSSDPTPRPIHLTPPAALSDAERGEPRPAGAPTPPAANPTSQPPRGANIGFADIPRRDGDGELSHAAQHGQGDAVTPEAPTAVALAAPADLDLAEADFRFLDPPEPGAHARLAVTLQNRSAAATGPISLVLAQRWLQAYTVLGAVPAVLDDHLSADTTRRFTFPPLGPGDRQTVELHLLATADEVDGPEVRVLLGEHGEVGKAQPRTVAPRPRPGPARTVTVPKLNVRAAVVPVAWEPPPFVVGQVQGSAAVSEGNTVLIGHLAGPQGDVFARLGQLRPGDTVTATSRGVEYAFVVSDISVRPYTDVSPTEPTGTPRLTLMTCTGQWSVARQDYSHRLWVVAEPADLAQQTIRANAERAAQAAREAETAAAQREAHEAEVNAGAASAQATQTAAVASSTAAQADTPAPPDGSPVGLAPADADEQEPRAPGILLDTPTDDERVPERLTAHGRRTPDADQTAPLWLFVRAEVEGSKWYTLPRPLEIDAEGRWQADLVLGGAAGIRHEIRVGPVPPETDALLRRHANERLGQPLNDLPAGFATGAQVIVERR